MLTAAIAVTAAVFIAGGWFIGKKMPDDCPPLRRTAASAALLLLTGLLCEIFIFNASFFATRSLQSRQVWGETVISPSADTLNIENINEKTVNIYIDAEPNQPVAVADITIFYTDGSVSLYDRGLAVHTLCSAVARSGFISLKLTGDTGSLQLQCVTDDSIYVRGIYINMPVPFDFSLKRLAAVLLLLSFVWLLRPSGRLAQIKTAESGRGGAAVTALFAVVAVLLLFTAVFAVTYTADELPAHHSQYARLAESFLHGHVYLESEVPQWLIDMEEPYDTPLRWYTFSQSGSDTNFEYDTAYYNGHYYVYFGVLPVILFYLPYRLVAGGDMPAEYGVFAAGAFLIAGIFVLIRQICRRYFPGNKLNICLLVSTAFAAASGVYLFSVSPSFYVLPNICAAALGVWGLYFWLRLGPQCRRPCACAVAGSLCVALIAAARPAAVLISFAAILLFYRPFIKEGFIKTKAGRRQFICLIVPYIIVAAALMAYNAARFSSPFDFGEKYNLTLINLGARTFRAELIPLAVGAFFFSLPSVNSLFPFVHTAAVTSNYMGEIILSQTYGGLFAVCPMLWPLTVFSGAVKKLREKKLLPLCVFLLLLAVLLAIFDTQFSGTIIRYMLDFSYMALLAAAFTVFCLLESADEKGCGVFAGKLIYILCTLGVLYTAAAVTACAAENMLAAGETASYYNMMYTVLTSL